MPANWSTPKNWNVGELLIANDFNAQLRDNMEWLKSRPFNTLTISSTTTTATSFAPVTGSSVSLSSVGGNMLIVFVGTVSNSSAGFITTLDLAIDGGRQGNSTTGLIAVQTPVANYTDGVCMAFLTSTPPSLGSHAYTVHWKVSAGTATLFGQLFVMEVR